MRLGGASVGRDSWRWLPLALTSVSALACGEPGADAQPADRGAPEPSTPSVTIVAPAGGSFQEEHEVVVWLQSTVPIVPAGDMTPGTGHHHLYLDAEMGDPTAPVPTVPGSIVHMGDASVEYTFEGVTSGPHRLIAVVADGAHVPLQPLVVDTVDFVVE